MSETLDTIRQDINRIDKDIVKLLSQRSRLVSAAGKHKKDEVAVRDDKRVEAVIEKVRQLATEEEVSPDLIEKVYRTMIGEFINQELTEFNEKS